MQAADAINTASGLAGEPLVVQKGWSTCSGAGTAG